MACGALSVGGLDPTSRTVDGTKPGNGPADPAGTRRNEAPLTPGGPVRFSAGADRVEPKIPPPLPGPKTPGPIPPFPKRGSPKSLLKSLRPFSFLQIPTRKTLYVPRRSCHHASTSCEYLIFKSTSNPSRSSSTCSSKGLRYKYLTTHACPQTSPPTIPPANQFQRSIFPETVSTRPKP